MGPKEKNEPWPPLEAVLSLVRQSPDYNGLTPMLVTWKFTEAYLIEHAFAKLTSQHDINALDASEAGKMGVDLGLTAGMRLAILCFLEGRQSAVTNEMRSHLLDRDDRFHFRMLCITAGMGSSAEELFGLPRKTDD
ncbi:hypothetical protein [Nonomuraea sediminis]|uniref:hypothetical protein n=1 Tax=Nonomuraea sediminis TaxID=2835864 RepID=UPI001BDD3F05|nr:hypothetical protein [Nonomuraea sediminis]